MGFFAKPTEEDATKPLQPEAKEPKVEESVVEEVEDKEDRSAFNCSNCSGEGLVYHEGLNVHERCPVCSGTGKVS